MKNLFFLFSCMLLSWGMAVAQDSAILYKKGQLSKGTVTYYGQKYDCTTIEFDAPAKVVESSIQQMMAKRGHNATQRKGMLLYRNVMLLRTELRDPVDVFAEVNAKSRSEKDKSIVNLLITLPNAIPDRKIEKSEAKAVGTISLMGVGSALLTNMEEDVSLGAHANEIMLLQEDLTKTEKELNKLVTDSIDLQMKLQKLQQNIADNAKAQADAKQKIIDNNARLEMLKGRKLNVKN